MLPQSSRRIYLFLGSTDMRKAMNGLSILVDQNGSLNPFSGDLFAFCNRRNTIMKILYWDTNGFCLWSKRLEKQRFKWPHSQDEVLQISQRQLQWLLDGLDLVQPAAHKNLSYSTLI